MDSKIKLLQAVLGENRVKAEVDLSEYLQTGLGGPAEFFYIATSRQELVKIIRSCLELKIKYLVVGSGSKIAISPDGIGGMVVKNRSDDLKISGVKGKVLSGGIGVEEAFVEADSGVGIKSLTDFASRSNLNSLDQVEGLTGTVGGNFYINPDLQKISYRVIVLNHLGATVEKEAAQVKKNEIILAVIFKLKAV
ncbi:FAD-binding protein [Candidatus Daviesbacteria bacterium]|nr:FAD-binding protein [Candidatus Daviesbacteria bacterium]